MKTKTFLLSVAILLLVITVVCESNNMLEIYF
ncbi:hypothetical protein IMSAGC004_01694 [Bacteroidaceae bacterium]|nr:hypothetical protein IMSAGC004_01694 [Bacteroidaceae bacterium]